MSNLCFSLLATLLTEVWEAVLSILASFATAIIRYEQPPLLSTSPAPGLALTKAVLAQSPPPSVTNVSLVVSPADATSPTNADTISTCTGRQVAHAVDNIPRPPLRRAQPITANILEAADPTPTLKRAKPITLKRAKPITPRYIAILDEIPFGGLKRAVPVTEDALAPSLTFAQRLKRLSHTGTQFHLHLHFHAQPAPAPKEEPAVPQEPPKAKARTASYPFKELLERRAAAKEERRWAKRISALGRRA